MPDTRFFDDLGPLSLGEFARIGGASAPPADQADLVITAVAPLDRAAAGALSFYSDRRYLADLAGAAATACFITPANADKAPPACVALLTAEPQAAYARAVRLRAGGLASDADVEAARAASATASQTAGSLGARAGGGLVLRAPVAGVVETVALGPGDTAAQGAAIAKVGALGDLRIRLALDAKVAATIAPGAVVRVSPLSGGGERFGVVASVDPRLDPATRLASVVVRVSAAGFVPGEPLQGAIVVTDHPGALTVPRASLLYDGDQPYLFVAVGVVAHRRDVRLGAQAADKVEIAQGVAPGDKVVVDGAAALDDGMAVREGAPTGPAA